MQDFYGRVSDILAIIADNAHLRTLDELKTYGFNDLSPGMGPATG